MIFSECESEKLVCLGLVYRVCGLVGIEVQGNEVVESNGENARMRNWKVIEGWNEVETRGGEAVRVSGGFLMNIILNNRSLWGMG